MKTFKRFSTLMLAILMVICSVSTTAFAAEADVTTGSDDAGSATVVEFEITPEMVNADGTGIMPMSINQTFNVTGSHTGSTRTYYSSTLSYQITVTDVNGNPAGNILSVQLYDSSNSLINEYQLWANGQTSWNNIPISYGAAYYFKYVLAYGDMRTLKVHMIIN